MFGWTRTVRERQDRCSRAGREVLSTVECREHGRNEVVARLGLYHVCEGADRQPLAHEDRYVVDADEDDSRIRMRPENRARRGEPVNAR